MDGTNRGLNADHLADGLPLIKQEHGDNDDIRFASGTALSRLPPVSDEIRARAANRLTENIVTSLQLRVKPMPLERLAIDTTGHKAATILAIALHYTTDTIAAFVNRSEEEVLEMIAQAMLDHGKGKAVKVANLIALHDEFTSRHTAFSTDPANVTCCSKVTRKGKAIVQQAVIKPEFGQQNHIESKAFPDARGTTLSALHTNKLPSVKSELLLQTLQLKVTPMEKLDSHPTAWRADIVLAVSLHYTRPTMAQHCQLDEDTLAITVHSAADVHGSAIGLDGNHVRAICAELRRRHTKNERLPNRVRCCGPNGQIRWGCERAERLKQKKERRKFERFTENLRLLEMVPLTSAEQARRRSERAQRRSMNAVQGDVGATGRDRRTERSQHRARTAVQRNADGARRELLEDTIRKMSCLKV
ncbi:hypothetical protein B0A48_12572 [Cryoendolithus antarcticus]|uniref:Uncharacterized protein n=1 Tax=Cryoendolithus antarcticus TaxID=1507870 RepID=A0A1V8SQS9_9PEZI|nr:hypothetical protein B0A48_12572 [Cryoendolithus antarcticus]